jgi:hypothetical protein
MWPALEHCRTAQEEEKWEEMKDNLQWKTTFNRRQSPIEDYLQWKTTSKYQKLDFSAL